MKRFFCECGAELFFDSKTCVKCENEIAFDIQKGSFKCISNKSDNKLCRNGIDYGVCNWLASEESPNGLCFGCEFNRTIPNLSNQKNIEKWKILEAAKKRLIYSLRKEDIPCFPKRWSEKYGFSFDFIEDQRTNPDVYKKYISTGYLNGIVTINLNEADPIFRAQQKEATNQIYRTVLGHFRHESGHHFYNFIHLFQEIQTEYEELFCSFGAPPYNEALANFYKHGPPLNWENSFITPYASAHHLEDWAETWSHYLSIEESLETAAEFGLINNFSAKSDIFTKISQWQDTSISLNEINRSVGIEDNYPFIINEVTRSKLALIEKFNQRLKNHLPGLAVG